MWVTCYTDASFTADGGGGWAVWLRSAMGRVVRHGRCPAYATNANHAELAAVFAGVFLAVQTWPGEVSGVLVCSDSQVALRCADVAVPLSRDAATRTLQERLRTVLGTHGITLKGRWVKGHRKRTLDTSAYLNHHVDRLAKQARRKPPLVEAKVQARAPARDPAPPQPKLTRSQKNRARRLRARARKKEAVRKGP